MKIVLNSQPNLCKQREGHNPGIQSKSVPAFHCVVDSMRYRLCCVVNLAESFGSSAL